jgi:transcriptional regulator with XRE-family HTH domain
MPKNVVKGVARAARPLGRTLRDARIKRGLSLRDLERVTGIAVSQLSRMELGTRKNPSFATIARVAAALGVSLDVLSASAGIGGGDSFDDGRIPGAVKVLKALEIARVNAVATLDAIESTGQRAAQLKQRR